MHAQVKDDLILRSSNESLRPQGLHECLAGGGGPVLGGERCLEQAEGSPCQGPRYLRGAEKRVPGEGPNSRLSFFPKQHANQAVRGTRA